MGTSSVSRTMHSLSYNFGLASLIIVHVLCVAISCLTSAVRELTDRESMSAWRLCH